MALPCEEELYKKFLARYKDLLQEMYETFLQQEARERLISTYPIMAMEIEDTGLSNRAKNALLAYDIEKIGDLMQYSPDDLRRIPNMGAGTVTEIEEFVDSLGVA